MHILLEHCFFAQSINIVLASIYVYRLSLFCILASFHIILHHFVHHFLAITGPFPGIFDYFLHEIYLSKQFGAHFASCCSMSFLLNIPLEGYAKQNILHNILP